jgi:hypothetical protein
MDTNKSGCNAAIEYLKENLKIGAPIVMKTGKSEFSIPKSYFVLNKYDNFIECGIPLKNGKMVRECFHYHEILMQHGTPSVLSPYISQI